MTEEQYLKTMIQDVKYGDYERAEELLALLRYSFIKFDRTRDFATKPRHYKEFIHLRVPIPMRKNAQELENILGKIVSDVYMDSSDAFGNYEYWGFKIKPKPVESDSDSIKEHDVTFDKIKDEIIQGIRNAKYTIWIAVAWFTNEEIYNELVSKKREGLHIRIITSDEKTNDHIMDKLEANFDVLKIPPYGWNQRYRLHHKFFIIDLEYVMHGSYNWSKNAEKNHETWATALDRDFVKKFADEFLSIYVEHSN
ncbi:phospholipase D-like domain-containing protein [Lysinibacillus sp. UGB7]|uniref:phospholipase D-like domain-containing protein n=1 Tax=Lysinibacillus sp. UGB7 TaxID=3411039 RepID=UPI003B82A5F6